MARNSTTQEPAKAKKASASEPIACRRELRQAIQEGKMLREEEKNRNQVKQREAAGRMMAAEFLPNEARQAAEAQVRATGLAPLEHTHSVMLDNCPVAAATPRVGFLESVNKATPGKHSVTPTPGIASAATPDSADEQINLHLKELNMKDVDPLSKGLDTTSPARKKSRASRPDTPGAPKSIIKPYEHKQKRVILEAAVLLTDKNPYLQFAEMIRQLLGNALMVDPFFQIDPISKVSPHPSIKRKMDIPNNLTLLTEYIKISGNMMAFQKKKIFSSGSGGKKKTKEEERDCMVLLCGLIRP